MKRHAPATDRNREPIFEVLRHVVPRGAEVLEIASGTGQHAAFLAPRLGVSWQPTDLDPEALASIDAWCSEVPCIAPARVLDTTKMPWPVTRADAIFCANMIHIAPFAACEGLLAGAAELLMPGAVLCLYGPYKRGGEHTAPSNAAFDESLRARDAAWGVRDLEEVVRIAEARGFVLEETTPMPANNLTVVFRKR